MWSAFVATMASIAGLQRGASTIHYKVTHSSQAEIVTIPAGRPIKPVYIRLLVNFIERVRSLDETP
jgi:hypothetical protein